MERDAYEARLIADICDPVPVGQELAVMQALIRAKGLARHEYLVERTWPNPDRAPEDELKVLKVHISHLRKRLRPPARIKNIFREGYVLLGVPGIERPQLPEQVRIRPTYSESILLRSLLDGQVHSVYSLKADLYEWRDTDRDNKIIEVFLCKLRRKLTPGWQIQNVWGRGWKLVRTH